MAKALQHQRNRQSGTAGHGSKRPHARDVQPADMAAAQLQAAVADPAGAPPAAMLALQRAYGNRAVQRMVQRRAPVGAAGGEVDEALQRELGAARGSGQALDGRVSAQMGRALGTDFSGVKVHADTKADTLNRSLSAQAFTLGSDIFFSKDSYKPHTTTGQKLLAHELTHVVQQGGAAAASQGKPNRVQTKLTVGAANDKYEQEADTVANHVLDRMKNQPAAGQQISNLGQAAGPRTQPAALAPAQVSAPAISRLSVAVPGVQRKWMQAVMKADYKEATLKNGKKIALQPLEVGDRVNVEPSAKVTRDGKWKFYKVIKEKGAKGKKTYVLELFVDEITTLSPAIDKLKAKDSRKVEEENEGFASIQETLSAAAEGMYQQKEDVEFERTQHEADPDYEETKGPTDSPDYTYLQDEAFMASDLAGFAVGAQKIYATYNGKDMSAWDKVLGYSEGVVDIGRSAADIGYRGKEISDTAHGITKHREYDKATGEVTTNPDSVLAGFGGVAGILAAVGSGIKVIKGTTEIVQALVSEEKHSKEEYMQMAGDVLMNALEMAEGIVGTIKTIYNAIGDKIGIHLAQALPGLDIAISGIRIIFDGYYLIKSAINWKKMTGKRMKAKTELVETRLGGPADDSDSDADRKERKQVTKQVTKDAEYYRKHEAETVNKEKYVKKTPDPFDTTQGGTAHTNPLYRPAGQFHTNPLYDPNAVGTGTSGNVGKKDADKRFSAEQLADYRLLKELRDINRKRVLRQSIHISTAITQIVAAGLVLGGITSGAGAGLKAAASGLEASLPLIRAGKQKLRDTAAKHQARDEGILKNVSGALIDPSRSTAAKNAARRNYAIQIINKAADLEVKDGKLANPKDARVKEVKLIFRAAGISTKELARHNGDPAQQVKALMIALSTREFLE